jgi:hypothetical protein
MRARQFQLNVRIAGTLYLIAIAWISLILWLAHAQAIVQYAVAFGVPSSASLGLFVAGILVPGMFGNGTMKFPINFTVPIVYLVLLAASEALWTNAPSVIVATPPLLNVARIWMQPMVLIVTWAVHTMALSTMLRPKA